MALPKEELGRWVDTQGRVHSHIDALFYGATGAGKTYLASTIVENPTKDLYVLACDPTGHKGIPVKTDGVRVTSSDVIRDVYKEFIAGGHGYKALLFDGMSFFHRLVVKEMGQMYHDKRGASDPDLMPIQGRIKVIAQLENTYKALLDLTQLVKPDGSPDLDRRVHVVFTTLEERVQESETADFKKRPLIGTDKINQEFPALFSIQGYVVPVGGIDPKGNAILDRKVLFTTMGGIEAKDRLSIFPPVCDPMPPLHQILGGNR